MFTYNYNGTHHTDTSLEYMQALGMDEEAIEAVQTQEQYLEEQRPIRRDKAVTREADTLFIRWQYQLEIGNPEAAQYKQAWLDKVSEINARYGF